MSKPGDHAGLFDSGAGIPFALVMRRRRNIDALLGVDVSSRGAGISPRTVRRGDVRMITVRTTAPFAVLIAILCAAPAVAQQANMTFFVTSHGLGKGADLGGLAGADAHCQALAQSAGATGKTWHAYLSTQGAGAVNARDRIGKGPWSNAKGVVVAKDVAELHGENKLTKQTALSEKGEIVNGRGDTPNRHDILTGSQADGSAFADAQDHTCKNWTSSSEGSAMLGHADRMGLRDDAPSHSWNSAHPSRGCSQDGLRSTGGDGLLYCFAVN
jgi:hypothetical protein